MPAIRFTQLLPRPRAMTVNCELKPAQKNQKIIELQGTGFYKTSLPMTQNIKGYTVLVPPISNRLKYDRNLNNECSLTQGVLTALPHLLPPLLSSLPARVPVLLRGRKSSIKSIKSFISVIAISPRPLIKGPGPSLRASRVVKQELTLTLNTRFTLLTLSLDGLHAAECLNKAICQHCLQTTTFRCRRVRPARTY